MNGANRAAADDPPPPRRVQAPVAFAAGWGLCFVVLLLVAVAAKVVDEPFSSFTRDPVTVLEGAPWVGSISNLGLVLWAAAVSTCALATVVLGPRAARPFIWGGLLTAVLLVDDALLIHEWYLERAGIAEEVYPLVYGGAFLAYVVAYRAFLRENDGWLLLVAAGAFVLSIAFDVALHGDMAIGFEDAAKLLGIVAWTLFFACASVNALQPVARTDVSISSGTGR